MAAPGVSVVVTTYNRDELLAETLAALAAQTLALHEVVVVDDGGRGGARAVAERFQPLVRYVRQENLGQQAARNAGVAKATGDWIAFLDDDDLWDADRHELLAQLIATGEVDLISGNFRKFGAGWVAEEGYFADHERLRPGYWDGVCRAPGDRFSVVGRFPSARLLPDHPFWPSTLALRRDLLARIGGWDESLRGVRTEDTEFVFRACRQGRLGLIWQPTLRYRCHAGNHVAMGLQVTLGRLQVWEHILRKHALADAERETIRAGIAGMRSEALWSAFAVGDYRVAAEVSRRIGWSALSAGERAKTVAARLLCRFGRTRSER